MNYNQATDIVISQYLILTLVPCKLNVFVAHFVELTFWTIGRTSANFCV